jgi:hypothetical protein
MMGGERLPSASFAAVLRTPTRGRAASFATNITLLQHYLLGCHVQESFRREEQKFGICVSGTFADDAVQKILSVEAS